MPQSPRKEYKAQGIFDETDDPYYFFQIGCDDEDRRTVVEETDDEEEEIMEEPRVLTKAEIERKQMETRKKQVAVAKVKVQLNMLKNDLQEAIQNQDFLRAQELKVEIDKLDEEQNKLQVHFGDSSNSILTTS